MKKISIEIGIPAYNESANIQTLLKSISNQVTMYCAVKTIYLLSDGSSDDTVAKAAELNIKNLRIIDSKERHGKSARMRELFSMAKTDYFLMFDADVVLANESVIDALVRPLLNRKVTLVSGHPVKVTTGTFEDKVMDVSQFLQDYIKDNLKNGQSVYACHGRAVGLKRELFENLELPFSSVGNDAYLYFFNMQNASGFEYCEQAKVMYKMPQSRRDFDKQKTRFSGTISEQAKLFGNSVYSEYKIPISLTIRALLIAFLKFHVYALVYFVWKLVPPKNEKAAAAWEVSESTKSLET